VNLPPSSLAATAEPGFRQSTSTDALTRFAVSVDDVVHNRVKSAPV
jgi:hypothetical protein